MAEIIGQSTLTMVISSGLSGVWKLQFYSTLEAGNKVFELIAHYGDSHSLRTDVKLHDGSYCNQTKD